MSWFAFYVGKDVTVRKDDREFFHRTGDVGVGKCDLSPGIIDNVNGSLYVVSDTYMRHYYRTRIIRNQRKKVAPRDIQQAIELFYKPDST